LIHATRYQQLNPLRIDVQLRTISSELAHRFRNMLMSSYYISANGPVVQELDTLRRLNFGTIEDRNQSFDNDVDFIGTTNYIISFTRYMSGLFGTVGLVLTFPIGHVLVQLITIELLLFLGIFQIITQTTVNFLIF
jgi:hypothetical protein